MNRNHLIVGLLIAIIVGMGFVGIATLSVGMPHGYDGVVANVHSVEHDYEDFTTISDPFYKGIDPVMTAYPVAESPTGLRASCNSPQYVGHVDRDPIVTFEKTLVDGKEMNETKTIQVSKVNFEMNIVIDTYGYGTHAIRDVTFWFELKNNPFSIFTGADEVAIAVLKVSTSEKPNIKQKGDDIDFMPADKGQQFSLYTAGDKLPAVPDWLAEDYIAENIAKLQNVRFKIDVLLADPAWQAVWFGGYRVDCLVEFVLSIDVMLFGGWTDLKPWEEFDPRDPDLTLWEQFQLWLEENAPGALSFIMLMAWVIVGFVATIVIFRFVPDIKLKLIATGIVWAVLIAIFGINAITVWLGGAG